MASNLLEKGDESKVIETKLISTETTKIKMNPLYMPTVLVGASGVGKGTLVRYLNKIFGNQIELVVSHTSREPRKGEKEGGINYFYVKKRKRI